VFKNKSSVGGVQVRKAMCPIKNEEISGDECLLICDVVDGFIKLSALPENMAWDEDKSKICKGCPYHFDVE
jgi:hypothetical protein